MSNSVSMRCFRHRNWGSNTERYASGTLRYVLASHCFMRIASITENPWFLQHRNAELYCFWTWIPAFFAASISAQTGSSIAATSAEASMLAFGVIAVGGIGCVWGGLAADRIGRERLVTWAMAASGTCALLIGMTFGRSLWLLVPVALVWGFFVIADSAQFSVLVTESVPAHAVGTALTVQTSLGFLLTSFTIQAVLPVERAVGWALAFPMLALGPALGIWSIQRLLVARQENA